MRKETFDERPDLIVDWRLFILPALIGVLVLFGAYAAFAQTTPPDGQQFRELLCRMAVGNAQQGVQDHFNLYVELYQQSDGTNKTDGSYGLLSGTYFGDRGISHFGQDLDDPKFPRFLKDGTQVHNADAAHLRAITSEFRQGACDELPTPN